MSETKTAMLNRESPEYIESTIGTIGRMVTVGALLAVVGYLLVIAALVLEFTAFHPAIESFFETHTAHSIAGDADRAGSAALNAAVTTIHQFPSTLLWLKLGGIAHVLVGIFVVLAGIVRVLALMPHRPSYEIERTQ